MNKKYIVTWATDTALKYDFNDDMVFDTESEANAYINKHLQDEDTVYKTKEVDEVFLYLYEHIENINDLCSFTDDKDDLMQVLDFFENVHDERLIKKYLYEASSPSFRTFDRIKFIDNEISILESFK